MGMRLLLGTECKENNPSVGLTTREHVQALTSSRKRNTRSQFSNCTLEQWSYPTRVDRLTTARDGALLTLDDLVNATRGK